jgi:hypothetical protein
LKISLQGSHGCCAHQYQRANHAYARNQIACDDPDSPASGFDPCQHDGTYYDQPETQQRGATDPQASSRPVCQLSPKDPAQSRGQEGEPGHQRTEARYPLQVECQHEGEDRANESYEDYRGKNLDRANH